MSPRRPASATARSALGARHSAPGRHAPRKRTGLTLAELLIVVTVLTALLSLVLPAVGHYLAESRDAVTRQTLARLRDVVVLYWSDMGEVPTPLRALFVNPKTGDGTLDYDPVYRRGWRGPYVVHQEGVLYRIDDTANFTADYGQNGDFAVHDGWGRPLVVQCPGTLADGRKDVRIVSAGPDGVLNVPRAAATASLTSTDIGDDLWIAVEVR